MARVQGNFLNNVSGLVGQVIVKHRGDTTYLSARPSYYNMSMEPGPVMYRGKFSVNGKFAGPLNKNEYVYEIWKKSKIKASMPLNKITKINFDLCRQDRPSADNLISPPNGFPLKLTGMDNKVDKVRIEFEPFRLRKNETKILCLLYVCYYDPFKIDSKYYELMKVKETVAGESSAEFIWDPRDKSTSVLYSKQLFFFCLITLDKNKNVKRYSETIGVDLGEMGDEILSNSEVNPKPEPTEVVE